MLPWRCQLQMMPRGHHAASVKRSGAYITDGCWTWCSNCSFFISDSIRSRPLSIQPWPISQPWAAFFVFSDAFSGCWNWHSVPAIKDTRTAQTLWASSAIYSRWNAYYTLPTTNWWKCLEHGVIHVWCGQHGIQFSSSTRLRLPRNCLSMWEPLQFSAKIKSWLTSREATHTLRGPSQIAFELVSGHGGCH